MTSATHWPCGPQTSGAQHCELSAHVPHVPLLQACPLQSLQLEQFVGAVHAGIDDGERIAWS